MCSLAESPRRSAEPTLTLGLPSCRDVCGPLGDIVPSFAWVLNARGFRGTAGGTLSVPTAGGETDPVGESRVSRRGGSMGFLVTWIGVAFWFSAKLGPATQSISAENGLDLR